MTSRPRRVVRVWSWTAIALWLGVGAAHAQPKFYPDDPLAAEPPPFAVINPEPRALSELLELFNNTVNRPGQRHPSQSIFGNRQGVFAAGGVNTLGEVMDSDWFVNRHATRRLTPEELGRGPGVDHPPAPGGPWRILTVRRHGIRPGILISDSQERIYLLLFDPPDHPEMSTGSQMVSTRIAHAIGYFVPECYLVDIERGMLAITERSEIVSSAGNRRQLTALDLDLFLRGVARSGPGRYRAVALYVSQQEWRAYLGPFQFFTQRSDDPNDIVLHEHRRDLRGLFVISAWLNHSSARAVGTADMLAEIDGVPRIRHFLADFFGALGSGQGDVKRAWDGNGSLLEPGSMIKNALGLGLWSPAWMRETFPGIPAVGRFAAGTFDPERWSPTERLAAFENRLPDDEFWGARQVVAFTDEDIATLVATGGYTDPAAAAWITNTLIARRNRIARTYFQKVLPLARFRIEDGRLRFDDLGVRHGVAEPPAAYVAKWFGVDNDGGQLSALAGAGDSFVVPGSEVAPRTGSYVAVRIEAAGRDPEMHVMVYLRMRPGVPDIVGIEWGWPGKLIVNPRDLHPNVPRYRDLTPEQRRLYMAFAESDAAARGRKMTAEEHFDSQTISARTTFDGVTHALQNSRLTDGSGRDIGTSLDLVAALNRIAGQYYGRTGDQQFRLFAELDPKAVEVLQNASEFFRDRDNTVFHVGYPMNFRQIGSVPNIQFSISEDGKRADIDVDYRSSGIPQGLFNGHLTAANSDVRAGDNFERHDRRWAGLIAWWRGIFGKVPDPQPTSPTLVEVGDPEPTPLPPDRPRGTILAEPQDAAQEFLTDWLVRRRVDEALDAASPNLFACVNTNDDRQNEAVAGNRALGVLRETMIFAAKELQEARDLTEAIEAIEAVSALPAPLQHGFDREFSLIRLTPEEATEQFLTCGPDVQPAIGAVYYATLFRFRRPDSAVLGLLWTQEDGRWKLRSYRTFEL